MIFPILVALSGSLLGASGTTILKKGLNTNKKSRILIGIFFFSLGVLLGVYALKFENLSIIYPITSLTYVWVMLFSKYSLKEKVMFKEFFGISIIFISIILIVA